MRSKICTGVVLAGLAVMNGASAQTIGDALKATKPSINWRVRYEGVEQAGIPENADAMTSRVRAGFQTGPWKSTSLLGEAVWTNDVNGHFNDTLNGQTQYPVVADPGGFAAINRFAITNKSIDHTTLTLGRQRIIYDDARFVGNVGWRQNEQTFDGLRAEVGTERINVDVALISQVNRIFGPDSPAGKWNGDIVLANASHGFGVGKLTGFVYSLKIDEAAALSSNTVGLRFSGMRPVGHVKATYIASYAEQTDAGANPADFSEPYMKLEGGVQISKLAFAVGFESLGSDGTNRVTTPLATLHAFQGWADKFLATPAAGIDDTYLRFAFSPGRVGAFDSLGITSVYHVLDANHGSAAFGDEFDVSIVARRGPVALTLKYATYTADTLFTDTDKVWFSMDYAF